MKNSIFFTSDTHFGHYLPALNRPFQGPEMDELLVKNWNSVVHPEDEVWVLGDFSLHMPFLTMESIFNRLVGSKHLVLGNHDHSNKVKRLRWASVHDVKVFSIPKELTEQGKSASIWLSHYPHRSWPGSFRGALHLHGHSHGHAGAYPNSLDVGVDCHKYFPISLPEVFNKIPRGEIKI